MSAETNQRGYGFGTFKGVFTPSILTILGVVMYLRMGWVLGNVGLPATLVIITLASGITFFTALALAALATNLRVGGGGAYYIISRSLGLEAGAAVGLPLYLAQALGISFYVIGFSESIVQVFPALDPVLVGVVTLVVLGALVYVSADLALKSQFLIMAAIAVSLVSFFAGAASAVPVPAAVMPRQSFWPVFAVFFPAVTGIEAGIAMSGDLKNPRRSLPRGTIAAVLLGYVVYLAIPIALYRMGIPADVLREDPLIMQTVARWGPAVLVGVWAAAISSAMGALLGAPRTLQALARDGVVPGIFGRGFGSRDDPRMATLVSFGIALTGVLLGDLNAIAPVLSMFFLTSYGVLNLSAGVEALISNPSWRPSYRVRPWVPLVGFIACLGAMLMIAAGATILAMLVCGTIYYLMKRRSLRARWGDVRLGLMMYITRVLLHWMEDMRLNERTWKPNLLVLSGSPSSRWYLIELADAIAQSRSFVTVVAFIPDGNWTRERVEKVTGTIRSYLKKRHVPAFIRAAPASDPFTGAAALVRSYGFGPLSPNTVMIGETEKPGSFVRFAELIQLVVRMRRNLVIVRERDEPESEGAPLGSGRKRRIDLWWSAPSQHAAFRLAVAILLRRSDAWRGATLQVKTIVNDASERAAAEEGLRQYLTEARVRAKAVVLERNGQELYEVIRQSSADVDLVFLGMRPPRDDESAEEYSAYYEGLLHATETLPATAMLMAVEDVEFHRIFEAE